MSNLVWFDSKHVYDSFFSDFLFPPRVDRTHVIRTHVNYKCPSASAHCLFESNLVVRLNSPRRQQPPSSAGSLLPNFRLVSIFLLFFFFFFFLFVAFHSWVVVSPSLSFQIDRKFWRLTFSFHATVSPRLFLRLANPILTFTFDFASVLITLRSTLVCLISLLCGGPTFIVNIRSGKSVGQSQSKFNPKSWTYKLNRRQT